MFALTSPKKRQSLWMVIVVSYFALETELHEKQLKVLSLRRAIGRNALI